MSEDDQFELEVPIFIELKPSSFATNDLGVYCTMPLSSDQHLGNYKGKTRKHMSQCADPNYVWTILSSRQAPLFYIDASDPKESNWLRFIRSTSDINKYNTICMQQNQQINYFTFKEIKLGEELVTYFPGKKKKNRKNHQNRSYKLVEEEANKIQESNTTIESPLSSEMKSELPESPSRETPSPESISEIIVKEKYEQTSNRLARLELAIYNGGETKYSCILNKCPWCPFVDCSRDTNSLTHASAALNRHFLKTHLDGEICQEYNSLSTEQIVENLMASMLNSVTQDYKLKCFKCSKLFISRNCLFEHYNEEHGDLDILKNMSCLYCEEAFESNALETYLDHLKTVHSQSVLENKLVNESVDDLVVGFDLKNYLVAQAEAENAAFKCKEEEENKSEVVVKEMNVEEIEEDDESSKSVCQSLSVLNECSDNKNSEVSIETTTNTTDIKPTETDPSDSAPKSPSKPVERKQQTPSPTPSSNPTVVPIKTYTCQLCKKQFEQRFDLSKHQCIELNLKLLKKKKEIRKKKWREAHWKRKIDLSYIETTSLTLLSQNIADNLSFCIDGTNEDLKAYSREVKDYLNTDLGHETQTQMALRSLHLYEKLVPKQVQQFNNGQSAHTGQAVDVSIQKKADTYFVDSVYNENACMNSLPNGNKTTNGRMSALSSTNATQSGYSVQCKNCRTKKHRLCDLVQHQRDSHQIDVKTTFDFYDKNSKALKMTEEAVTNNPTNSSTNPSFLSSDLYATSSVGYLSSDPFAYIINLYWDQKLPKKCENCQLVLNRPKYRKHILTCSNDSDESMDSDSTQEPDIKVEPVESSSEPMDTETIKSESPINQQPIETETIKSEPPIDTNSEIYQEIMAEILTKIENEEETQSLMSSPTKQSQIFDPTNSSDSEPNTRISQRIRHSKSTVDSPSKTSDEGDSKNKTNSSKHLQNMSLVSVKTLNNRKIHTCVRCGLEFTSANSVFRHQEKSCLRVRVINLKANQVNKDQQNKNKCPICSCIFYSTHRVSIHIYKHHRNLLGSALKPPSSEAKRLHEIQLKKLNSQNYGNYNDEEKSGDYEEEEIEEDLIESTDTEMVDTTEDETTRTAPQLNSTF